MSDPENRLMTVGDLAKTLRAMLEPVHGREESGAMVYRLFEHYLHLNRASVVLSRQMFPGKRQQKKLLQAARQLADNIPLQYITGEAFFDGLTFRVNRHVLIPRPETEEMVSLAAGIFAGRRPHSILDIGTGSGCIAVSLKKHFPESRVIAVDVSKMALRVAQRNASDNGLQVEFLHGDILKPHGFRNMPVFDLIISNPPYVTESEKSLMRANVLDYEPGKALFVPDKDPLLFYNAVARFARRFLAGNGMILFEINENFGKATVDLLKSLGYSRAEVRRDFRGKDRFVIAQ
ncbi:MAG TPA: peptide chain release factor N(5)-glutamine methyltransferase [Bacteroidales bacterium]|nr:peptide chain release factor N(5)-glutamine methyltransferase [Bacteroidales bacterium]HPT01221.1 peptide chain release factor N(5)-glutamine methyltransferase [Bacteroidales bacterium]